MATIEQNKIQLLEVEGTLMQQEIQLEKLEQNKLFKMLSGSNIINHDYNHIDPLNWGLDFQSQKKRLFGIAEKIFGENQLMFEQNQDIQKQNLSIKNKNITIQNQMNKISLELNQYLQDQQNNYF